MEHAHLDYINYPTVYLTGCKQCHEYADKRNPNTKQLAYEIKLAKMWRYLSKHRKAGYKIVTYMSHPKTYRIIEPKTNIIKEVVTEPTY